jgi:hypothetical protein
VEIMQAWLRQMVALRLILGKEFQTQQLAISRSQSKTETEAIVKSIQNREHHSHTYLTYVIAKLYQRQLLGKKK